MKRYLITGGGGFIGSHLAARLHSEGHEVIVFDDFSTGQPRNIEHLLGPRFRLIEYDVTRYVFVNGPLHAVIHLASLPSPVDYLEKPIETLRVGALGTHKALGLARAKHARFLLASTSEVYGNPTVHPQPEHYTGNVSLLGPRAAYDESKRFAEALTLAYRRKHQLKTRICRIFNTYGPHMRRDDGRVITSFIEQALSGLPITVYDGGIRTRSFCYVDDLVEGIVRLIEHSDQDQVDEPINLGNPHEVTVNDFAQLVKELTNSASDIVSVSPSGERTRDDPDRRRPDITKAMSVLGWEPRVVLRDGLQRTIDYFRRIRSETPI